MTFFSKFFWGIFFSVGLPALYVLVFQPDAPFAPPSTLILGEGGYDPRLITAPAVSRMS